MSYKRDTKRVLSGGVNLVAPADAIGDDQCQKAVNLAHDAAGSFRVRRGHTVEFNAGSQVNRIINALDSLWEATASDVRKGAASACAVGNAAFVAYKRWVFAMSPSAQRKSDGTNDYQWLADPPTAKPVITAATPVETVIVSFTSGFAVDPTGDDDYAEAGTLQIHGDDAETYTATKAVAANLRDGFSLDDVFQFRTWCRQWKKINRVTVEVDVNTGAFDKDYYTASMEKAEINAGAREELTFYLRKRPQDVDTAAKDKKRYGHFDRVGTTPDKDWRSVVAVRIKVDFTKSVKIRFYELKMVGDADNTLEGDDFVLYQTFTTADGHETDPGPASDPITVNRTGIDASGLEVSGDPQVTGSNLYLSGGTLGQIYRVNETPIVGATYQIRVSDDDLTSLGLVMETDHQPPPAGSVLAGPYFGHLLAIKGRRLFWSKQDKPYAWPGSDDDFIGSWVDLDEVGGDGVTITLRTGGAFIYCEKRVHVLQGDPDDFPSLYTSQYEGGITSLNGVCKGSGGDYIHSQQAIRLFTGDSAQKMSDKVDPIFKGRAVTLSDGTTAPAITDETTVALGCHDGVLWVSYDSAGGRVTIKCDLANDRWYQDSRAFTAFFSDGATMVAGQATGNVVRLDQGATDGGAAIPVDWLSKAHNQGILDCEKTYEDATIWADTGGVALLVAAYLDDGATVVALGAISSTTRERFVLQFNDALGVKGRNCAVGITGNAAVACEAFDLALNWYVEAREAESFDSDEMDMGTGKVKEVMAVEVDLYNPAPAQLIIQSDLPGHEVVTRDSSHTFQISTTRRWDTYVLDESVLGHNVRTLLDGEDFGLSGMRILTQIIGSLYHGAKGQFYRSDPIGMNSERVKLYRELHVKYAASGASAVKCLTELPSGAIAEVTPVPAFLASTGGVRFRDLRTAKLRLPGNAKGRMIEVEITPVADLRLEELQVDYKVVGEPAPTPWNWFPFPLQATSPAIWQDIAVPPDEVG